MQQKRVNEGVVFGFLAERYNTEALDLVVAKGGEVSHAFFFGVDGEEFVIRVDSSQDGYLKDRYAYENFGSAKVPIPEFIEEGRVNDKLFYAITRRVKGRIFSAVSLDDKVGLLNSLIAVLNGIHETDVSMVSGYGWVGVDGIGDKDSFADDLIYTEGNSYVYLMAAKGARGLILENIHKQFLRLLPYAAKERHLIHGDYGFGNTIVDEDRVVGVIDWANMRYGDFLYDIAWMTHWGNVAWSKEVLKFYEMEVGVVDRLRERIWCYHLHIGMTSLKYFKHAGKKDAYERELKKIQSMASLARLLF